jgi:exopolysaccharide biosynthesis polyprenyl glycosylphosphotransferase
MAPDDFGLVIKRLMDILGSLVLLVVLSPFFFLIAVSIKLTSPGPAIFRQERYGWGKRRFRMLKFRTMVENAEDLQVELEILNEASGPVFKIRDDPRITRLGHFLRRTSLDELPQLWHVLTGEMSLVGPRPLPLRDVGKFDEPWLMRRFSMRPGLTCLWQISGRSNVDFDKWIGLDLEYIDRWSLWLDLAILVRTLPAVIGGRGAN